MLGGSIPDHGYVIVTGAGDVRPENPTLPPSEGRTRRPLPYDDDAMAFEFHRGIRLFMFGRPSLSSPNDCPEGLQGDGYDHRQEMNRYDGHTFLFFVFRSWHYKTSRSMVIGSL